MVEYAEDGLFNLWGKRTFVQNVEIKGHPYRPFNMRDELWCEGFVLRHNGQDWKVKRVPTIERMWDGVPWESYIGEKGWVKLWPRPGKMVLSEDKQESYLKSYVAVSMIKPLMVRSYQEAQSVVKIGDVYNVIMNGELKVRSTVEPIKDEVVSAKIFIFDEKSSYLLKEQGKTYDLVGGKIELGETSTQAAIRESKEETTESPVGLRKVSVFQRVTQNTTYTTFLYIAPFSLNSGMQNLEKFPLSEFEGTSVWVKEFYGEIRRVLGPLNLLRRQWENMSGRNYDEFESRRVGVKSVGDLLKQLVVGRRLPLDLLMYEMRNYGYVVSKDKLMDLLRSRDDMHIDGGFVCSSKRKKEGQGTQSVQT